MFTLEYLVLELSRQDPAAAVKRRRLTALWPVAEQAAKQCLKQMPAIGFRSTTRRQKAFVVVCRCLDARLDEKGFTQEHAQLALTIMGINSRRYRKAESAFTEQAPRLSARDRQALPATAAFHLRRTEEAEKQASGNQPDTEE